MAIDVTTDIGKVRLLLNDTDDAGVNGGFVFSDAEIQAFLNMEGGAVKLAAATAIDVNASNELLASKVLKTPTVTTDGAKLADALRRQATTLREQHYQQLDDDFAFEVVDFDPYAWLDSVDEH